MMEISFIPEELIRLKQWCNWDEIPKKKPTGRKLYDKFPHTCGKIFKSNDPSTYGTFEDCVAHDESHVGFVISEHDDYCGIDMDFCIDEEGGWEPWAIEIVEKFKGLGLIEISPSGTGAKILVKGKKPAGRSQVKVNPDDSEQQAEIYDFNRFWCVTSWATDGSADVISNAQSSIDWFYEKYFTTPEPIEVTNMPTRSVPISTDGLSLMARAEAYASRWEQAGEGMRNNSAFRNAGNIAQLEDGNGNRLPFDDVLLIVADWNSGNDPPLDPNELMAVVRSAYKSSMTSEPKADRPMPERDMISDEEHDALVAQLPGFVDSQSKTSNPDMSNLVQIHSFCEMALEYPRMRPVVIEGLIREGETMNIIAPPKTGKSWLTLDLAIAIGTGGTFLGKFQTKQGKVLVIDNELHPETIAGRIQSVCCATERALESLRENVFSLPLRGSLVDLIQMERYFSKIQPGEYKAIVLDAFYRFLPKDTSENDNGQMAQLYNMLDVHAARIGCCFILIHHSSKGDQGGKSVTDVGSGAGSMSRAADCHLIIREDEQPGYHVIEAAVRSFPPLELQSAQFNFPIWNEGLSDPVVKTTKKAGDKLEDRKKRRADSYCECFADKGDFTVSDVRRECGGNAYTISATLFEDDRFEKVGTRPGRLKTDAEQIVYRVVEVDEN